MGKPIIGFVSLWQNRGQAEVTRHIRDIFLQAGHQTRVLARPSRAIGTMPNLVKRSGVWDIPDLTVASRFEIPVEEYVNWVEQSGVDILFCDMNFQFEELQKVRRMGVKVIGRFVWERFGPQHVEPVQAAYDVVYSLTRAEQARYQSMGLNSPYVRWGVHPELLQWHVSQPENKTTFLFHGGMLGRRKPIESTVAAFKSVQRDDIELIIKSQATHQEAEPIDVEGDPRIRHIQKDLEFAEYQSLLTQSHVCLAPSRWEGLGVHLFEAAAHGMPVIATDMPPVDEVVDHDRNGFLVECSPCGKTGSGLTKFEPSTAGLSQAIEQMADADTWHRLHLGQRAKASELSWQNTAEDYLQLIN